MVEVVAVGNRVGTYDLLVDVAVRGCWYAFAWSPRNSVLQPVLIDGPAAAHPYPARREVPAVALRVLRVHRKGVRVTSDELSRNPGQLPVRPIRVLSDSRVAIAAAPALAVGDAAEFAAGAIDGFGVGRAFLRDGD